MLREYYLGISILSDVGYYHLRSTRHTPLAATQRSSRHLSGERFAHGLPNHGLMRILEPMY